MPKGPAYRDIESLKTHPLYGLLSSNQQTFLLTYIETNCDRQAAVKAAYGEQKNETTAMRLLRNSYIRQLVAIYFGYEMEQAPMGKTELLGLIAARLRNSE